MAGGKRAIRPVRVILPEVTVEDRSGYTVVSQWPWHGVVDVFYDVWLSNKPGKTLENFKAALADALSRIPEARFPGTLVVGHFHGGSAYVRRNSYGEPVATVFRPGTLFTGVVLRKVSDYVFVDYVASDDSVVSKRDLFGETEVRIGGLDARAVAVEDPEGAGTTAVLLRREMYEAPRTREEAEELAEAIARNITKLMSRAAIKKAVKELEYASSYLYP